MLQRHSGIGMCYSLFAVSSISVYAVHNSRGGTSKFERDAFLSGDKMGYSPNDKVIEVSIGVIIVSSPVNPECGILKFNGGDIGISVLKCDIVIPLFPATIMFFVSAYIAETNRVPFDINRRGVGV